MNNEAARYVTIHKAIVGIPVIVITVFMLLWAIYTGFRLAMEPRGKYHLHCKYHFLTFSIGVITVVYGFLYFTIGLAKMLELAVDLSSRLQQKEEKGGSIRICHNTNVKYLV